MKIYLNALKNYTSVNHFLKAKNLSDSLILFYKKNNHMIKLNGRSLNTLEPVKKDSKIELTLPKEKNNIPLIDRPLNIVYEDDFYLIVNKPDNLATSPTRAHITNNLSGMLANYFKDKKIDSKVHIVNRLDKETRGLVIVAKHQYFHALLAKTKIIKKYRLVVEGVLSNNSGTIEKRIKKDSETNKRIESESGEISITKYLVKKHNKNTTSIEAELITGRTHQLRVHFSSIGHPIVGDPLYGTKANLMYLQSFYLKFKHPIYSKIISIKLKRDW